MEPFPVSRAILRSDDFAAARRLLPVVKAASTGRGRPLIAASDCSAVVLPQRLRKFSDEQVVQLFDSPASLHALSANVLTKPVQVSAQAYLDSFFNKELLAWLCLATGVAGEIPLKTRAGQQCFLHLPTVTAMRELLKDVKLIDVRVVICLAWIVLHELELTVDPGDVVALSGDDAKSSEDADERDDSPIDSSADEGEDSPNGRKEPIEVSGMSDEE